MSPPEMMSMMTTAANTVTAPLIQQDVRTASQQLLPSNARASSPSSTTSTTSNTDFRLEEQDTTKKHHHDTNNPSNTTVLSGVTSTSSSCTSRSVQSSNSSTMPLSTTDEAFQSPTATVAPTVRHLIIPPQHILYLRSHEIQSIVQCYQQQHQRQQQQQHPPPPSRNGLGGRNIGVENKHRSGIVGDDVIPPPSTTSFTEMEQRRINSTTSASPSPLLPNGATIPLMRVHRKSRSISSDHLITTVTSVRSTPPTFLIVEGPTGSGKSKLLQAALEELVVGHQDDDNLNHTSGYYIRGTFDVLQHPDPYRVYILALNDFVSQVMARHNNRCGDPTSFSEIVVLREAIWNACGDEIHVLIPMIPLLSTILFEDTIPFHGASETTTETVNQTASALPCLPANTIHSTTRTTPPHNDATQQFVFVIQKFFRAICSVVQSIVLVLEDVHYADTCSIDVLCNILTDLHQIPGLFVAATHDGTNFVAVNGNQEGPMNSTFQRPGTTSNATTPNTNYFVEYVRAMEQNRHAADGTIHIQTISIDNLDVEQVQYLLTQTLQPSSPSGVQVDETLCALVMKHTSGNLYNIFEFLYWLEDFKLLVTTSSPDGSNESTYWTWDIDDICCVVNGHIEIMTRDERPNANQLFYSFNKFEKLSSYTIDVLKVGACLGSSYLEVAFIEYVLDDPIRNCVEEAVDMNILLYLHDGMDGKRYTFAHENIQMSVYHLIPESEREFFHLEIGRRIWHRLDQNELDRNIYVVLSQVWIGRRLIEQYSERYQIAALCLRAGQKAAKSSAFRISLFYLEFGVELLGDRGWCDEYDLTLTLYNATAEMEVYNSKYDKMELLFNDILKNGRCADDTIQARRTQVYALCVSDRHHEGLNQGIQLMADLGFAFPRHFSLWALRNEVKAVLLLLKGKSNDYLKRLPIIDNSNALAAMHVLHVLSIHASLARPRLAIFVSLKMIKLTLKYGLSFMSPLAFSTFGMLCIKIFPTTEAALRYGELSLELLDQFQVREYLPRVYIGYYACTYPWKHHISDSLDYLIRAERVGIQTGDVEAACLCANIWGYMATDADIPLDEIEAHFLNFQATLKSRRQKLSMQLSFSLLQTIQYLQGKDVDFIDTERLLQYSVENKVVLKMANIRWWQAKMALLFNDWSRADEIAYTANFFKNQHNIPPTSEIVQTAFVNGMIALVMASQPRHGDNAYRPRRTRRQYIAEGQRVIRFLEKYVLWAPTNYYDKQMLLKAELAVVKGQTEEAMRQYVCAIALSKLSRNRLVEGLSNERAGRYCLSVLNDSSMAMKYFDAALSVYKEWKAHRKVDHLQLEMKTLLALHQSQHNCQC